MLEQSLRFERLEQKIAGARAHSLDGPVHIGIGRHQHHGKVGVTIADFLEQRNPVHGHHAHIADHQRNRLRIEQAQRFFAAWRRHDGLPGKFERIAHSFAQIGVVFDNQHR